MSLTRSAWKRIIPEAPHNDLILIVPEWKVIFTAEQFYPGKNDRWFSRACWIREEPGGAVYTSLPKAEEWIRESYRMEDGNLVWTTPTGTTVWSPIEETEMPAILETRIPVMLQRLGTPPPPE